MGEEILILVQPTRILDDTLEGEDRTVSVQILIMGQTGCPLGMKAEHFKVCLKGCNTRKGPRHKTLEQTGECDVVSVLIDTNPNSSGMDNNGANS